MQSPLIQRIICLDANLIGKSMAMKSHKQPVRNYNFDIEKMSF